VKRLLWSSGESVRAERRVWHTFDMTDRHGIVLGYWSMVRVAFYLCFAGCGAGLGGVATYAQDATVHTLHVYTNTIQVPVLVLKADRKRLGRPIASSRFSISLDAGPWFRVDHVRPEGDDSISLAVLLDVSGRSAELMPYMDAAIAALAPSVLLPKDRVSVFALDCGLVQSPAIAPQRGLLKTAVERSLQPWADQKAEHRTSCINSVHLWDAVTVVAEELQKMPGRRVMLIVSDGEDTGSRASWTQAKLFAGARGVAMFGLRIPPESSPDDLDSVDKFSSLCESSGGLVMGTNGIDLQKKLTRFVAMLRERYIVEFPRPSNGTAGFHDLMVRVENSDDFVRPAGASFPLADPALMADPTTVPEDPTKMPALGTRHILLPPQ
jgi:hypothetical protein